MLKEEARDPHKVQVAVKYAKKTAMVFKSEERRRVYAKHASLCKDEIVFKMQVLGKPQCQKLAKLSTEKLAEAIMGYLKAPISKIKIYLNHLALLVSFY